MGLVPDYRRTDRIIRRWPVAPVQFNRKSFTLNGTDEYIVHGNVLDKSNTDPITICGWFKSSAFVSEYLVSKFGVTPTLAGYGLRLNVGLIDYRLYTTTGTCGVQSVSSAFADGTWHFIAAGYDGSVSASGITIMADGAIQGTTINGDDLVADISNTGDFRISGRTGDLLLLNGSCDEVSVWSRKLTPSEMSEVYRARDLRLLPFARHLQGYWSGDGSDGSIMPDYSGNGYNGTPQNMDASNFTTDVHTPT